MKPLKTALALALAAALLAGCGGADRGEGPGGGSSPAPYVDWPMFGRIPERTHYLPREGRDIDPPLREAWSVNTHALIEFPPAIAGGFAYVANKYGNARAIRLRDHRTTWERVVDRKLSGPPKFVTSPVYSEGRVLLAYVNGDLYSLDAKTGKQIWKRNLGAHLESSPLAVRGRIYLGDDDSELLCLRAADGKPLWRFEDPGAIKASPSYHDGRVYVADYQGSMYSLHADSGDVAWRTNTTEVPPYGDGGFFSSAAIAFGHVYAARDDGNVYAFDLGSGKVAWSFPTGNYVYGSPAVAEVPGTPPSVYIGSYDGRLFALDASSGKRRWSYEVGGPVPGTAVVIGHTVYSSSFKTREAVGIDARTHRRTFHLRQAGYTPAVSDGRRVYLIGYYEVIGLEPKR